MLSLLSLLQARRDWAGAVLADRLGVTTRTVRRDVDRLRDLGYRITAVKGPDGGYRLEAGAELPPLLFDDEQAVALAIALQNAVASGVDIEHAAQRALVTVRQVLPPRLRPRVDGVRFTREDARDPVDPAVLEAVSAAVRDRVTLRFDYRDEEGPARRTEPHGLVARGARWYLVAWDIDRGEWRVFRVDRIRPRIPSGPRFPPRTLPTGDAGSFVDARAKGATERDAWPCVGRIEIALPARDLVPWVDSADVTAVSEGMSRVSIGSWSWAGVLSSVLRFDAPFRVVDPPELAEAATRAGVRLSESVSGGSLVDGG